MSGGFESLTAVAADDWARPFVCRARRFVDNRGWFAEVGKCPAGAPVFVQSNLAANGPKGVIRGLHWQEGAAAQGKWVTVAAGAIRDVAVDLDTNGVFWADLEAGDSFWVPARCAHGYQTLVENTAVLYQVTAPWAPSAERGLHPDSLAGLGCWDLPAVLSGKDTAAPLARQLWAKQPTAERRW